MHRISAYFGLLKICQPKAGETVVVTGAAGAVGSIVGQIARIIGCKVIGIAGSHSKCDWLISDLKFDYAIDYKNENVQQLLKKIAPNGIDCFFDNVGGELSSIIINMMNEFGRIAVCGSISAYNVNKDISNLPRGLLKHLLFFAYHSIKMYSFICYYSHYNSTSHFNKTITNGRFCCDALVTLLE